MSTRGRLAMAAVLGLLTLVAPLEQADACGWDWETYHAEAKSLPCVHDALLGYWPKHTAQWHETRIAAADQALRWVPGWTEGLDAKGLSLLHLGRLAEATAVLERRAAIAPDAYPSHANLGTVYTFTGAYAEALTHIDAAMAIEPEAHFGREQYHRALVVFLARVAEQPKLATRENFLGVTLDDRDRLAGSAARFEALGLEPEAFDALVSMLTVYGADGLAEVYLTLGELLAVRGHPRLAYTAYRRARELDHPRAAELGRWMRAIDRQLEGVRRAETRGRDHFSYRGIGERYKTTSRKAKLFVDEWQAWEREQLDAGLAIWTQAGLERVYGRMHEQRRRCDAPRIITDARAPLAGEGLGGAAVDDDDEAGDEG
jgi:tetratricopeptide (TPR) repeat protein